MSDEKGGGSLQIRTEVPKESSGRLLDALTDIIRPFTERRGLKADQIRLQREDVLIEIARKATERLRVEGKSPQPVPYKFLIPFMEKSSLEDMDSKLQDRWATLLASASTEYSPMHVTFAAILSELGPDECHIIKEMVGHFRYQDRQLGRLSSEIRMNRAMVEGNVHLLVVDSHTLNGRERFSRYLKNVEAGNHFPARIYWAFVPDNPSGSSASMLTTDLYEKHALSLEILERNALLRSESLYDASFGGMVSPKLRWAQASPLAGEFVWACDRD